VTKRLGRVTCDLSISVDGYSAGLDQTEQRPFGDDAGDGWGERLHAWMFETPEQRQAELDRLAAVGAFIMGRNMFGPVRGRWDRQWKGWWGDNPPYHAPVFVLTHHPRDRQPMDGGTTFHFVTDGIESALQGPRRGRRPQRIDPRGRDHHQPVPRRRLDRRAAAPHRAVHARRRHTAVRRSAVSES
jgi:dihydrofolate reductase